MMWRICETCAHSAWRDGKTAVAEVCLICTFGKDGQPTNWKEKFMSNADRIRAMSDEELGRFLATVENRRSAAGGGAIWKGAAHAIDWLKQPAEEVDDDPDHHQGR